MEERRGSRNSRRMIVEMVALGIVASVAGIAIGLAINWFPDDASTQSGPIDRLWDVLVICSVPIFVGVAVIVVYAARIFRQRPGEEQLDGPPIHGNTRIEIIWTALPTLMLVALVAYAAFVLHDIEKAPASAAGKEMRVDVYGEQFAWTFKYAGTDGKQITTTQLYLPVDKSVKFDVHSKDVIHDFWVPAFRMKVDAVPGVTTGYRVTPNKLGAYPVVCAELCGLGHAYMRQKVTVMEQGKFDAWLAKQSAPAPTGASGASGTSGSGGSETASVDGKTIFTNGTDRAQPTCGSCHALADAGTSEGVGPNLSVLAGQTPEQIKASIVDPEAIISPGKPAGIMPKNYGELLSPEELDALVGYLADTTKK